MRHLDASELPDWFRINYFPAIAKMIVVDVPELPPGDHTVAYTGRHVFMHPKGRHAEDEPSSGQKEPTPRSLPP